MLSIRERNTSKNIIKNFCLAIGFIEKRDILKRENKAKNLKKYKMREIEASSTNMPDENKKRGGKSRNASQLIENKNTSKKNISSDCIFLKAKYT